jgi:hypothetical protein
MCGRGLGGVSRSEAKKKKEKAKQKKKRNSIYEMEQNFLLT